jgi:hypothetical protein
MGAHSIAGFLDQPFTGEVHFFEVSSGFLAQRQAAPLGSL